MDDSDNSDATIQDDNDIDDNGSGNPNFGTTTTM
jgi:hypothetical protein